MVKRVTRVGVIDGSARKVGGRHRSIRSEMRNCSKGGCGMTVTTLAEATPVHEAERLQQDLARAGIKPYAWVINQSLLASGTNDPLLSERGRYEIPFIRKVAEELSPRCALIPWLAEPPIGAKGLAGVV